MKGLTAILLLMTSPVWAHDTWVETNTNLIRVGDAVHVDLKLGNHGNDHRDFKLAGKVDLQACRLNVIAPEGHTYDLRPELIDQGYSPSEGYWSTVFAARRPGLYLIEHTMDQVVRYAPLRSIKSAKTFFVVSESLDRVPMEHPGYDRVLGHPLEIVPRVNPVTPMGPGQPIEVEVLYRGKPLPEARVSFIPRGTELAEQFDSRYERLTDATGTARFTPTAGNVYLVVTHHVQPDEGGENYTGTKYSATLTVYVPQVCPCCGE